ncbi:MAG: T9SS type A sorting domain-containing protein [Bacteroidetes bacterium]|jgi:glucose/arabinose dehydrogenase|nr:T9SS type A sorting domain-containing protein [Bacteroidota bacterium]
MPTRLTWVVVAVVSLLAASCQPSSAQHDLEVAFPNLEFSDPVDLQSPRDGTNRLFVVEQAGVIKVFENDPQVPSAEVFLDIQNRVLSGGEQGLLGLAFHPDFMSNGYFYVDYTAANPSRTIIARYQVDTDDPDQADAESEQVLLEVEQPFSNHNAGQIQFGPDGYLYVTLGDGGAGGDPEENGQDRSTLLGSILRIDVDNPSEGQHYGIPADNPFVGADCGPAGCREEIYAYGLRNPWRISFDPETGALWAGDVGQNAYEEIDIIEKGGNYGWNTMEGTHCFDPSSGCDQSGLALPVWEYPHSQGQSITGGYVYRGNRLPDLVGKYVYADFVSGRIWALTYDGTDAETTELVNSNLNIASFGVDANDELYLCAFDGKIYRLASSANTGADDGSSPGEGHSLGASYPNPSRQAVHIPFTLAQPAPVTLMVFDVLGRKRATLLEDALLPAGPHAVTWTAQKLPAGVYLYRIEAGAFSQTRPVTLVR